MADIRRTPWLDTFDRANEDPLQAPWYVPDSGVGWLEARLIDNCYYPHTGTGGTRTTMYHSTRSFDGDVEVWAHGGFNADLTEGWYLYLLKDVGGSSIVDGYSLLAYNSILPPDHRWVIRRHLNGGSTDLVDAEDSGLNDSYAMLRINGDDVEAWRSNDGGANWTMVASVTDTTYRDDMWLAIGIASDDGTGPIWQGMGGGAPGSLWTPQYYRRPKRRGE